MEPTDDGRAFAERVRHVLGDLDAAVASVQANRTVRLGVQLAAARSVGARHDRRVRTALGVRAVLLQRCDDPVTALRDGVVDAAVMRGEVSGAALAVHHLFSEPRVAAVSARSPLAERDTVKWEELGTHPLVVNTLTGTTRAESWAAPDPNREIVTCTNFDEWLELVAGRPRCRGGAGGGAPPRPPPQTSASSTSRGGRADCGEPRLHRESRDSADAGAAGLRR